MLIDQYLVKKENRIAWLLTLLVGIIYTVHAFYLDGSYGGGDGIRHYLVARWSWKHPDLLLYHWGKPFFTLVTSFFSQFGLIGMKVFNAFLGALTAYFCFRIAKKMDYSNPLATIIFASIAPVYILCINSGLTEPMFAFILVLTIFLFLEKKFIVGTILLSFLPFVRSEGNLMFPLFFLVLIFRGKWMLTPLLSFGTIAYSIIGYFHYKDIFWIKTKNPYTGSNFDIYGQGELLHYVNAYQLILGLPLAILFVIGVVWLLFKLLKKPSTVIAKDSFLFEELFIVYGAFFIYLIAHSIFWWKGLFGSLGLERSIAGVVPIGSLIAMRGLEFLQRPFLRSKIVYKLIVIVFLGWALIYPFKQKYLPLELSQEEQLVKTAAEWYNNSEYKDEKIYYLYPYFMHKLNLDAFDGNRVGELWGLYPAIKEWGIDVIPLNTIILWDAHFGANEAYIPLDSIMADPNFKLVKSFKPENSFTTLGGYNFEIHAFIRIKAVTLIKSNVLNFDFESSEDLGNYHLISNEKAFSGSKSSHLKSLDEFGVTFDRKLETFENYQKLSKVSCSFKIYTENTLNDLYAVMTIDSDGKSVQWDAKPVANVATNNWTDVSFTFNISSEYLSGSNRIKLYCWNKGKNNYYMDDLKIEFESIP